MQVTQLNNITYPKKTTSFKAKLSKQDLNLVLKEIKGHDVALVPKLYTLLEILHELGGKNARFVTESKKFSYLLIDDKVINETVFKSCYSALFNSLIESKSSNVMNPSIIRMPESIFEQKWWVNKHKTIKNMNIFVE